MKTRVKARKVRRKIANPKEDDVTIFCIASDSERTERLAARMTISTFRSNQTARNPLALSGRARVSRSRGTVKGNAKSWLMRSGRICPFSRVARMEKSAGLADRKSVV